MSDECFSDLKNHKQGKRLREQHMAPKAPTQVIDTSPAWLEHHLKFRSLPEQEGAECQARRCPGLRGPTRGL